MAEHDEVYGEARAEQLRALLRRLAERIQALDAEGHLLQASPEASGAWTSGWQMAPG